jgi:hypothetical protein
VKRKPKYEEADDYGGGARAVDIIIRGGIGIGGGGRRPGGDAPSGGGGSYGGQL